MLKTLQRDIQALFERDPATRSVPEILLCYPGLHAVWGHRLAHWVWRHNAKLLARWVSHVMRALTGIEIHPGARIGPGLVIDHGMGVVIGETAEIGTDVTMYHGVTLGGTSLEKSKRHPTVGDRVVIGAGAKVLGPIIIGSDSRIGANAVVVKSVLPNSVVVGVPGQVIERRRPRTAEDAPDLNHTRLPDVIDTTLQALILRVKELERRIDGDQATTSNSHVAIQNVWQEEDFSI